MKSNRAIIKVQELNCKKCAMDLAQKLSKIEHVSHLEVYYESSEVCFNFQDIKGVANVENLLSEVGFNPKGEKLKPKNTSNLYCKDTTENFCIDTLP